MRWGFEQDVEVYLENRPPKAAKIPLPADSASLIKLSSYYQLKPLPSQPASCNPYVLTPDQHANLVFLFEKAREQPLAKYTTKGWEVYDASVKNAARSGHYTIAGGRFAPADGSFREFSEFEWSSSTLGNSYMGCHRHFAPTTTMTEVRQFTKFCATAWTGIMEKFEFPEVTSFFAYPAKAFPTDLSKRNKYSRSMHTALRERDLSVGPFVTMVKSGEVYSTSKLELDSEGFLIN